MGSHKDRRMSLDARHFSWRRFVKAARWAGVFGALIAATACTAVVGSSPLSGRPDYPNRMFLSTGGTSRPHRTIGFVQVTGFGNEVAGVIDVGDAQVDSTVRGALADAAVRLGGQGVINIEFLDENPRTPAEQGASFANSVQSTGWHGRAEVETHWRSVVAWGEVIQFTQ
jgi:hypothetical protein